MTKFLSLGLIALVLAIFSPSNNLAIACTVSTPDYLSFYIFDGQNPGIQYQKDKSIRVGGCVQSTWNKQFLIATGPDITRPDYTRGSSFDGDFFESKCQVSKSPFEDLQSHNERLEIFQQQSAILGSCLAYKIDFFGRKPLLSPQGRCRFFYDENDVLHAQGSLCYLPIGPRTEYTIEPYVPDGCALDENKKMKPSIDFRGVLGLYVSEDATGNAVDLKPLEFVDLRMSVSPDSKKFPLTNPYSVTRPRWLTSWDSDIHPGKVRLRKRSDQVRINTDFLVDHRCPEICLDDSCAKTCSFMAPLGTETRLYQMSENSDKASLLTAWYDGGVIPAHWQGEIPLSYDLPESLFKKGKTYRVVYDLSYPDAYYRLAIENFKHIAIEENIDWASGFAAFDPLKPLSVSRTKLNEIPFLRGPMGLGADRLLSREIGVSLATLESYLTYEVWPPYYVETCNWQSGDCFKHKAGGPLLKEFVEFRIDDIKNNGAFELNFIRHGRDSVFWESYSKDGSPPDIDCP